MREHLRKRPSRKAMPCTLNRRVMDCIGETTMQTMIVTPDFCRVLENWLQTCAATQETCLSRYRSLFAGPSLPCCRVQVDVLRKENGDLKRRSEAWHAERTELLLRIDNLKCACA